MANAPKFTGSDPKLVAKFNALSKLASRTGIVPGQRSSNTVIAGSSRVGGGGSTSVTQTKSFAMCCDTVPGYTSIDGTELNMHCDFGWLESTDASSGVYLLQSSTTHPRRFVPIDDGTYLRRMACMNVSGTDIRGSTAHPVVLSGVILDLGDEEVFYAENVFDLRALPNYTIGVDQGPLHEADDHTFKLDGGACAE